MITVRTSPAYVNRVRQDWTANGGVYGDGGVYAVVPSNDPFAQLGPTLDLTFAGVPTNQLTAATVDGYSINLNLSSEIYQIAAQYAVWVDGSGMTQRNFADIVTFTRASTATYFNSAGTLTTATTNEARFDYDPSTLAARGLLIEEQRTNSIRNNTMQGAVAGTPGTLPTNWIILGSGIGTLTQQVVGTGTSNGISYIDYRVSGTTSTTNFVLSFEQPAQIVAANGQTWANSAWVALIGGSTTNITTLNLAMDGRTAAGGFVAAVNNLSLLGVTPTLTRYTSSGTIANASIERVVLGVAFSFASGVAIDITLRIGLPQLELGAFATSVIPTTTTALTRSADVASVNTLSPWYNASAGTLFSEWSILEVRATNNQRVWSLSDGTNSQFIAVRIDSAAQIRGEQTGGSTVPTTVLAVASANTVYKTGVTFQAGDSAICFGGGTVYSNTTFAYPAGINKLTLGNLATGSFELSGHLRRLTYYPRRLSNADLQAITA